MAQITPDVIFPNMTSDGTNLTIPIADIPGLSAAEADPSTGNGAEMFRLMTEVAHSKITALSSELQPTELTITKTQSTTAQAVGQIRNTYTVNADVAYDPTAVDLVAEA